MANYGTLGKNSNILLHVPFLGTKSKSHFPWLFSNYQIKWLEAFLLANQEAEPWTNLFTSHLPDTIRLSSGDRDCKERNSTDLYWSRNGQMLKWGPMKGYQAPAEGQKLF